MFSTIKSRIQSKIEGYVLNKAVKKIDELAAKIEEENKKSVWSLIHRQLRNYQWACAELIAQANTDRRKFERMIEEMITLNTNRGYDGSPVGINVSLAGLFFRFAKGNPDAIEAIGNALAGMVRVEFEAVMA